MSDAAEATTAELARQQFDLWNGQGEDAWVEQQSFMDAVLSPFIPPLLQAIEASGARRVLDVGCGAGASTFAAAEKIGRGGATLGVDISTPLIEAAQRRAAETGSNARFLCADAGAQALEEPPFDLLISRFGVMFFAEAEKAFANLHAAMRPGGRLCAMVWRSPRENPFMTVAKRAAEPDIDLPRPGPEDPGQFAFADPDRVRRILEVSGWREAEVTPFDVECVFPARDMDVFITKIGPMARPIAELPVDQGAAVVNRIREAFEPFVKGDEVRFSAACWRVSAIA